MSSHCFCDWNINDAEPKEGVVEHMAMCMKGNRDWTKMSLPETERQWQPPAFAILSPADNLIFYLAVLIDQCGGKVTEAKLEEWLDKSKFEQEEWRGNLRAVSTKVLQNLGVWEENERTGEPATISE